MRTALAAFIILFILIPLGNIDRASSTDIPEPVSTQATSQMSVGPEDADKGFTISAPWGQAKIDLVDHDGVVVHSWQSNRRTTGTTQLLPDGTLLRGRGGLNGQSDAVQILDWDGTVIWDYQPPDPYMLHHDIELMPNGNILVNAKVPYTYSEMVDRGRDPDITSDLLWVEPILEIEPTGANGGNIVWMWDPLDHIVQDFDAEKSNFGVVRDHPELLDINFPREYPNEWQHSNSVAYNAKLDQIMITNRNFDEFWVIDHNTTTAEAANHTGGAHGRGGDLLYRWGNPRAYDTGEITDQVLWGPHDAQWIGPGLPGEGNILVFNNGLNMFMTRPEGKYTTVEEIIPPVNATGDYYLAPGLSFGPSEFHWCYNASPPESFFAQAMGGAERLPNGNTLVCGGTTHEIFEVNPQNQTVWTYRSLYPFKANRYYPPALAKVPDLIATEDVPLRVNLSGFIADLDTDLDNLLIDENSFFASVSGHDLLMQYPDGITTDVINVTVSDGIFEMGRDVRVNITPVNDPPVLAPIPDITAVEAVPYLLDLQPFISDPDTDIYKMRITVDSTFVGIDRGILRFMYPNGVLTDRVLLTVSDGEMEARVEILVNVMPVNDPPFVDRIPDMVGVEDVPWTIDLGNYIRDIDNPIEDISVVPDSRYASISGLNLTLLYPDGVTSDMVSLTVSDGQSETVVKLEVTIEPVNDPPVLKDALTLNITEDISFSFDVGPAIFDIDTPREELTLTVESPFIDVEGHVLILLYPDGVYQDEVAVEIWDGELGTSAIIVVNVEPVNDPPVVEDILSLTIVEDEPFSFDIEYAIFDIDTPLKDLTLWVDSPYIVVDGLSLLLLYPEGAHQDEIDIEIWDGEDHTHTTLVISVEEVNDPPFWYALPDLIAVEDVAGELPLDLFIDDLDTPMEELVVDVASSHGTMDGRVFRFIYPDGVLTEEVIFTLSDGEFQVILSLNVTVSPVNDAPELLGACVDPTKGSAGTSFMFKVVLKDVDMGSDVPVVMVEVDGVTLRCSKDDLDTGRYDEGVVFFQEMDLGPGIHYFRFIADDGDGGVATTEPFSVTVTEASDTRDGNHMMTIVISLLIIGAVFLVAVLQTSRNGLSRSP